MTFRCGELGCFFPTSGNFRGENEYEAVNLVVPSFQTNLENWNEQWWKVELLIIAGGNSQKKWWVQPAKSSKSGFCQVFFGALTMQENCRCHWIMGKCEFQALVSEWSSNFSGKMSSLFQIWIFNPPKKNTVDGCEILHQLVEDCAATPPLSPSDLTIGRTQSSSSWRACGWKLATHPPKKMYVGWIEKPTPSIKNISIWDERKPNHGKWTIVWNLLQPPSQCQPLALEQVSHVYIHH